MLEAAAGNGLCDQWLLLRDAWPATGHKQAFLDDRFGAGCSRQIQGLTSCKGAEP
jgi:hypothetical protein